MPQACYMLGGQSLSATEMEFIILKMYTAHKLYYLLLICRFHSFVMHVTVSLMLALHKFRVIDERKRYSETPWCYLH